MFVLEETKHFSSKQERDTAQATFEAGYRGADIWPSFVKPPPSGWRRHSPMPRASMQAESISSRNPPGRSSRRRPRAMGQDGRSWKTRRALDQYVGYYMVDYLRPLAVRPAPMESTLTSVRGYFGRPDNPNSGAIVTYERAGNLVYGFFPVLTQCRPWSRERPCACWSPSIRHWCGPHRWIELRGGRRSRERRSGDQRCHCRDGERSGLRRRHDRLA